MIPVCRPSIGDRELAAVGRVFDSGWLGMGSEVERLERRIGEVVGRDHVVCVSNGTGALFIALDALGLGPGDEVVLPSMTYVASAQAVTATGARPVFCDVLPDTLNLDPADVERRVTPRTRAVMPVHYRGLPCDMDAILDIAERHGLRVVEDAAHAFGSAPGGRAVGSFGDVTCFSFDPIKVVTCGEGGAAVTGDPELADLMQRKRILGIDRDTLTRYRNERSWMYDVQVPGYRLHMSNISAAVGLVQLDRMEELVGARRRVAERYDVELSACRHIETVRTDWSELSPFMYVVRVPRGRDRLIRFLRERGIGSGLHYIPVHTFTMYREGAPVLPVTERLYGELLTLPLYPDMTEGDAARVVEGLLEWDGGPA